MKFFSRENLFCHPIQSSDQRHDCKIGLADVTVYRDLFFLPCPDDESAKKPLMTIYDKIDLAQSDNLSPDEIFDTQSTEILSTTLSS